MTADSDEKLWNLAIDGDHSAFGVIFKRHVKRIFNHCLRRTANVLTAEDLTSVVFLEAWRSRQRVHFVENSALPWLLGVATNVCRNAERSLKSHRKALARLSIPQTTALEADQLVDRLNVEEQVKTVIAELANLDESDRMMIELSVGDNLSYQEISVALNIPIGTVRSRLSRARARLRLVIAPSWVEETS